MYVSHFESIGLHYGCGNDVVDGDDDEDVVMIIVSSNVINLCHACIVMKTMCHGNGDSTFFLRTQPQLRSCKHSNTQMTTGDETMRMQS